MTYELMIIAAGIVIFILLFVYQTKNYSAWLEAVKATKKYKPAWADSYLNGNKKWSSLSCRKIITCNDIYLIDVNHKITKGEKEYSDILLDCFRYSSFAVFIIFHILIVIATPIILIYLFFTEQYKDKSFFVKKIKKILPSFNMFIYKSIAKYNFFL